jgi:hypothetical protein
MATSLTNNRSYSVQRPTPAGSEWNPQVDGPHFVVIGAQKAGSSFIQDALRAHPEIYMPRGESSLFHGADATTTRAELEKIARKGGAMRIVGIKRPDYLANPSVAERIQETLPSAKLLAVIRNPVDRALSAYYHYMLHGLLPVHEPDVGFTYLLDGRFDEDYPRSREILEYGFYAKHLSTYSSLFPKSQLHITVYDSLRSSPTQALQDLFRFLGVNQEATVKVRQSNPTVYSPSRIKLIRTFATPLGGRIADPTGNPRHIPGMLRALQTVDATTMKVLRRPNSRPHLSPDLRRCLHDVYKYDVLRLQDDFGLEVAAWR